MHDILKERLARQLEALPEQQLYQVLDYIEFLSSKYARDAARPASGLQRFGERLEDKLRINRVGFDVIRGTLNVVGAADRVVSGLAEAGRSILGDTPPSAAQPPSAPAQLRKPEPPRVDPPRAEPPRRSDIIIEDD